MLDEFLATSNDAVVLAGSDAVERLGINLGLLLLLCSNQPGAAREVLAQYQHARRVPPETLLETGGARRTLRRSGSPKLGYAKTRWPRMRNCRC